MIKYKGARYKVAQAVASIDDAFWRHASLNFWVLAVVESNTGTDLPTKAKKLKARTWDKVPELIRMGVGEDADTKQWILEACAADVCYFINLDFIGWEPGVRGGAKNVQTVQNTLEWIEQFRSRPTISGSKLIWAEIGSNVKQR